MTAFDIVISNISLSPDVLISTDVISRSGTPQANWSAE